MFFGLCRVPLTSSFIMFNIQKIKAQLDLNRFIVPYSLQTKCFQVPGCREPLLVLSVSSNSDYSCIELH